MNCRIAFRALGLAAVLLTAASASAQNQGPPNALQGFAKNRNEPIRIESQSLEVRDKDKTATFIDNVKVTQGDTTLESRRLIVYYNDEATGGGAVKRAAANAAPNQQIRRLEAHGGVVVTQRDQTAVGDQGIYDMATNSMTLVGNVVVTQGKNVIRGDRLWVDLATGVSRVESRSGGKGRVQGVFLPSNVQRPGEEESSPALPSPSRNGASGRRPNARGADDRGQPAPALPPIRIN